MTEYDRASEQLVVTRLGLLSPGIPVIATPLMFTLDMRTGSALQSCVESLQAANMSIQLMKNNTEEFLKPWPVG